MFHFLSIFIPQAFYKTQNSINWITNTEKTTMQYFNQFSTSTFHLLLTCGTRKFFSESKEVETCIWKKERANISNCFYTIMPRKTSLDRQRLARRNKYRMSLTKHIEILGLTIFRCKGEDERFRVARNGKNNALTEWQLFSSATGGNV